VTLLSLDVSTSGEDRRDAAGAQDGRAGTGDRGRDHAGRGGAGTRPVSDLPLTERVIELPDGVLVDVLA
jgi:hypothetical protein